MKHNKMTDNEIFTKATEKAVNNGWKEKEKHSHLYAVMSLHPVEFFKKDDHFPIIFSHSWAKAFWGEKRKMCVQCLMKDGDKFEVGMSTSEYTENCELNKHSYKHVSGWQHNLRQMVETKDRLKYIEKFL